VLFLDEYGSCIMRMPAHGFDVKAAKHIARFAGVPFSAYSFTRLGVLPPHRAALFPSGGGTVVIRTRRRTRGGRG
jgi:hypothetical protein